MRQIVQQKPQRRSRWNPKRHRRHVRRQQVTPGGVVTFVTRSFTRDDDTQWHPSVDTQNGTMYCDCPDHRYRGHICKHLARALSNLHGAGVAGTPAPCAVRADGPVCHLCGQMDALCYLPVYDVTGNVPTGQHICRDCAHDSLTLTADDFPDFEPLSPADKEAEAAYWRAMDAAESYATYVEDQSQREAAEHEDEEAASL